MERVTILCDEATIEPRGLTSPLAAAALRKIG